MIERDLILFMVSFCIRRNNSIDTVLCIECIVQYRSSTGIRDKTDDRLSCVVDVDGVNSNLSGKTLKNTVDWEYLLPIDIKLHESSSIL